MWNNWTGIENAPLDTLLLVETCRDGKEPKYHTGKFFKNNSGQLIGIVGNCFHFDHDIKRYKNIQHLLTEG